MKRNDITCIPMTKFSRRHREIAEQFVPECMIPESNNGNIWKIIQWKPVYVM